MMHRLLMVMFVALLVAAGHMDARQTNAALDKLFASAEHKTRVAGDLKGAIEDYKRIVAIAGSDRAAAARALLLMADAYRELRDPEAVRTYERIVLEFPTFGEAERARKQLSAGRQANATAQITVSNVWTTPAARMFVSGRISADGRYFPFLWEGEGKGNMFVRDVRKGTNRQVTDEGASGPMAQYGEEAAISRDGRVLAYAWVDASQAPERYELRLVNLEERGIPRPRVLLKNDDIRWLAPQDWSRDGRWIAVQVQRTDRSTQLGLVSVRDGSLRVLKTVNWNGSSNLALSPDGKHLAFDVPAEDGTGQRDVFVVAVDGSRQVAAVIDPSVDSVFGWSPDGRLLFMSDRNGSSSLWATRIDAAGRASAPELIRRDHGRVSPMGVTDNGDIYSVAYGYATYDIEKASFDSRAGTLSPGGLVVKRVIGTNRAPDWSPDGKELAYISERRVAGPVPATVIGIQTAVTGATRELVPSPTLGGVRSLRWAPDGRAVVVAARDDNGRNGAFRVDVQTGEVTTLTSAAATIQNPILSSDGTRLYFARVSPGDTSAFTVLERDLVSGTERDVLRTERPVAWLLSPDSRFVATPVARDRIALIPTAGGERRELTGLPASGLLMWAPDSRSLYATRTNAEDAMEVWQISLETEAPRKLDGTLNPKLTACRPGPCLQSNPRIRPDGNEVVFDVGEAPKATDVWVLKNALSTRKP